MAAKHIKYLHTAIVTPNSQQQSVRMERDMGDPRLRVGVSANVVKHVCYAPLLDRNDLDLSLLRTEC